MLEDLEPFFPSEFISIADWRTTWLETASLNVFEAVWDPASTASTATLKLHQSAFSGDFPTLRAHQFEVAFFDENAVVVETRRAIIPPGADLTTLTYNGSKLPKAIMVNSSDQGFF